MDLHGTKGIGVLFALAVISLRFVCACVCVCVCECVFVCVGKRCGCGASVCMSFGKSFSVGGVFVCDVGTPGVNVVLLFCVGGICLWFASLGSAFVGAP